MIIEKPAAKIVIDGTLSLANAYEVSQYGDISRDGITVMIDITNFANAFFKIGNSPIGRKLNERLPLIGLQNGLANIVRDGYTNADGTTSDHWNISAQVVSDAFTIVSNCCSIKVIAGAGAASVAGTAATASAIAALGLYIYSQPSVQTHSITTANESVLDEYLERQEMFPEQDIPPLVAVDISNDDNDVLNNTISNLFDYIYDRTKDAMTNWTKDNPPAWDDTTEPSPSDDDMGEYIDLSEFMPNLSIEDFLDYMTERAEAASLPDGGGADGQAGDGNGDGGDGGGGKWGDGNPPFDPDNPPPDQPPAPDTPPPDNPPDPDTPPPDDPPDPDTPPPDQPPRKPGDQPPSPPWNPPPPPPPDKDKDIDPLVLNLDKTGNASTGGTTYFDHDGDGFAEHTAWAGQCEGLLALDRNGNGQIDDGNELFGDYTILSNGRNAVDGFQALAELDENKDGVIDAKDSAWSELRVWTEVPIFF